MNHAFNTSGRNRHHQIATVVATVVILLGVVDAIGTPLASQPVGPPVTQPLSSRAIAGSDTVTLGALQHMAETTDRRAAQLELLAEQSRLRLATIRREQWPSLTVTGSAQYLSDVPSLGIVLPGGGSVPSPSKDQYDSYLSVQQPIIDPTRRGRIAVERAQVAESQARVRAALWQQRLLVSNAYFAIKLLDAQQTTVDAVITDLTARRRAAGERVAAGAALPSESDLLDAEIARQQQARDQAIANRDATREVLSELVGRSIAPDAVLLDADDNAPLALTGLDTLRARPEYAQFDRTRDVLAAQRDVASARELPRLSVFGRGGYGSPGLNPLGRTFDTYFTTGIQVQWSPWNWGHTERDQQLLTLQQQLLTSEEAAFTENVRRGAITDLGTISALERALVHDDTIIAIRERVVREARLRHDEGELTSAEYVARLTELQTAQLDRDTRRVRLRQAREHYLTITGREAR